MVKVTIIRGKQAEHSENYIACMAILKHCRIGVEILDDTETMMKLGKGHCHPELGFVITYPDEKFWSKDFFGLVQWIENSGLKPI